MKSPDSGYPMTCERCSEEPVMWIAFGGRMYATCLPHSPAIFDVAVLRRWAKQQAIDAAARRDE